MRLALLSTLLALGCAGPEPHPAACDTDAPLVVVDTRARALWLCRERSVVARVKVALGRGGLGKTREGDGRTPLGTYSLGPPRASAGYGTFIPIGYPTEEQRRHGFTGSNVGIHGPRRWASRLGGVATWVDWTAGCVATSTDEEIATIAAFVTERRPRVLLR